MKTNINELKEWQSNARRMLCSKQDAMMDEMEQIGNYMRAMDVTDELCAEIDNLNDQLADKPCAIPEGEYLVQMTYSPKYRRQLPLITGDRRFNSLWQGIRIHSGNTAQDTQGCILVGENKIVGMVINSRLMLQKVVKLFEGNKAKVKGLRLRIC